MHVVVLVGPLNSISRIRHNNITKSSMPISPFRRLSIRLFYLAFSINGDKHM